MYFQNSSRDSFIQSSDTSNEEGKDTDSMTNLEVSEEAYPKYRDLFAIHMVCIYLNNYEQFFQKIEDTLILKHYIFDDIYRALFHILHSLQKDPNMDIKESLKTEGYCTNLEPFVKNFGANNKIEVVAELLCDIFPYFQKELEDFQFGILKVRNNFFNIKKYIVYKNVIL